MKIIDAVMEQIAQAVVWAGDDNFRWKMKNLGFTGWGVDGIKEPEPEVGFEKE